MNPNEIMSQAQEKYCLLKTFAMFSGGHDSLSITHWAMNNGAEAVVHVNTGIGIEETRKFVRDTCKHYGWPLLEYVSEIDYEDIVKKYGFPGPHGHRYMYVWLKERAVKALIRDHKTRRSDKIGLVTGVRLEESRRRMGHVEPVQQNGAGVWIAPFLHMTKKDVNEYITEHSLPRNPVVDHLHMSGECLCGAYAHRGELEEIRLWYPETAQRIDRIQEEVRNAGFPWNWEDPGPPSWYSEMQNGQMFLDDDYFPMCVGCKAALEETPHE